MKRTILTILLICLTFVFAHAKNKPSLFGMDIEKPWTNQGDYAESVKDRIESAHKVGFNACTLYKAFYLSGVNDTIFHEEYPKKNPAWSGSSYKELVKMVKQAHKNKMKVQFAIELDLLVPGSSWNTNFREEWRGKIYPNNAQGFFNEFERQIIIAAKFCKKNHIEYLNIGQELTGITLPEFDSYWTKMISSARKYYKGKIVYHFNGGSYNLKNKTLGTEFYQVSPEFVNLFDEIGITIYPNLSNEKNISVDSLVVALNPIIDLFQKIHEQTGKNIIIGETSCPSTNYALSNNYVSWAWGIEKLKSKGENDSLQINYVQALVSAFGSKEWMSAIYWHNSYYNKNNFNNELLMKLGTSPFIMNSKNGFEAKPAFKNLKKLLRK